MTADNQTARPLRIFLCHSSGDKHIVRQLYQKLRDDKFEPWLDEEDLLPGQNWRHEITKVVRSSDAVIVCLSRDSINKEGFVQKEIRVALDVADEKLPDAIFIIPLRLEECNVPERLSHLNWVDLFKEKGYERLVKALESRRRSPDKTVNPR
jgi:hypothetical protein